MEPNTKSASSWHSHFAIFTSSRNAACFMLLRTSYDVFIVLLQRGTWNL